MNEAVRNWLMGQDTGTSSMLIVAVMENLDLSWLGRHGVDHPHDPSDFGRCYRLLQIAPEYLTQMHKMRSISPEWRRYVDHWDMLTKLYEAVLPDGRAPVLYDRMRTLIADVWINGEHCPGCDHPIGPPDWKTTSHLTGYSIERGEIQYLGVEIACQVCNLSHKVRWDHGEKSVVLMGEGVR